VGGGGAAGRACGDGGVGEPTPALTTVLTTLERLRAKGLVAREREGRVYVYRAVVAPERLVAEPKMDGEWAGDSVPAQRSGAGKGWR